MYEARDSEQKRECNYYYKYMKFRTEIQRGKKVVKNFLKDGSANVEFIYPFTETRKYVPMASVKTSRFTNKLLCFLTLLIFETFVHH